MAPLSGTVVQCSTKGEEKQGYRTVAIFWNKCAILVVMTTQAVIDTILPVLKARSVKRASLFGSYAKDQFSSDSDVDVLVELPEGSSLLDLVDLKLELEDKLEKEVDVLTYKSLHPLIRDKVLQQQMPIL